MGKRAGASDTWEQGLLVAPRPALEVDSWGPGEQQRARPGERRFLHEARIPLHSRQLILLQLVNDRRDVGRSNAPRVRQVSERGGQLLGGADAEVTIFDEGAVDVEQEGGLGLEVGRLGRNRPDGERADGRMRLLRHAVDDFDHVIRGVASRVEVVEARRDEEVRCLSEKLGRPRRHSEQARRRVLH